MSNYEEALAVMTELFSKDYQFALATSKNNIPTVRFIDTYFDGKCFYFVTNEKSQKAKDIRDNPVVALASRKAHMFRGKTHSIGHPLLPQNHILRENLIKVFNDWYFKHNNENDENLCCIIIEPKTGFFHKDGIGYEIDFENKVVESFPFNFTIMLTEE